MSTDVEGSEVVRPADGHEGLPDGVASTETYRTDGATVFYDVDNPVAWIQADDPVRLSDVQ